MPLQKEELCNQVGAKLRALRMDRHLSIEKLALETGIEYTQLSRIERGKINTSIYQIYRITKTLDVPMPDVFHHIK